MRTSATAFLVPLDRTPKAWLAQILAGESKVSAMPEQNISKILAERVERAIREAGFRSQEEFANVVGVPKATVNRILLGTYDVRI